MTRREKVTFTEDVGDSTVVGAVTGRVRFVPESGLLELVRPVQNPGSTKMPKRKKITHTEKLDAEHDVWIEEVLARHTSAHAGWKYEVKRGTKTVLHYAMNLSDRTLDEVRDHAARELKIHLERARKKEPAMPGWRVNAQFVALKLRVVEIARINEHPTPSDEAILDVVIACGCHPEALAGLTRLASEAAKIAEGS